MKFVLLTAGLAVLAIATAAHIRLMSLVHYDLERAQFGEQYAD